jgi:radical SAM superfamily enzyme YgiQ (UPF0313 family)
VKKDIDVVQQITSEIRALSWRQGFGEDHSRFGPSHLKNLGLSRKFQEHPSVVVRSQACFLQDADSLILKTDQIVDLLRYLKKAFPSVERITTYARAKTISTKTVEELTLLSQAGLSRIHIGLETGYDPLLAYVQKGVTAQEHVNAGKG